MIQRLASSHGVHVEESKDGKKDGKDGKDAKEKDRKTLPSAFSLCDFKQHWKLLEAIGLLRLPMGEPCPEPCGMAGR